MMNVTEGNRYNRTTRVFNEKTNFINSMKNLLFPQNKMKNLLLKFTIEIFDQF